MITRKFHRVIFSLEEPHCHIFTAHICTFSLERVIMIDGKTAKIHKCHMPDQVGCCDGEGTVEWSGRCQLTDEFKVRNQSTVQKDLV